MDDVPDLSAHLMTYMKLVKKRGYRRLSQTLAVQATQNEVRMIFEGLEVVRMVNLLVEEAYLLEFKLTLEGPSDHRLRQSAISRDRRTCRDTFCVVNTLGKAVPRLWGNRDIATRISGKISAFCARMQGCMEQLTVYFPAKKRAGATKPQMLIDGETRFGEHGRLWLVSMAVAHTEAL